MSKHSVPGPGGDLLTAPTSRRRGGGERSAIEPQNRKRGVSARTRPIAALPSANPFHTKTSKSAEINPARNSAKRTGCVCGRGISPLVTLPRGDNPGHPFPCRTPNTLCTVLLHGRARGQGGDTLLCESSLQRDTSRAQTCNASAGLALQWDKNKAGRACEVLSCTSTSLAELIKGQHHGCLCPSLKPQDLRYTLLLILRHLCLH